MARLRCTGCNCAFRIDEDKDAGKRVVCPKCGKLYRVRMEKKRTLGCPACRKKLKPPPNWMPSQKLKCPYCKAAFRLKPPRRTALAKAPPLEVPEDPRPARNDEAAAYKSAPLIDWDAGRRTPRYVWYGSALALIGLIAAGTVFVLSQFEVTTATISGQISYKEKPVRNGLVSIIPKVGVPIAAGLDESGTFEARNVPFGEVLVTVISYPEEARNLDRMTAQEKRNFFIHWGRRPLTTLPSAYAHPETTPLKYNIAEPSYRLDINLEGEIDPAVTRTPLDEE